MAELGHIFKLFHSLWVRFGLKEGMSKKEIAQTMTLSVKTIDTHSANLMNKLDIHDRVELARFAIREGLAEA